MEISACVCCSADDVLFEMGEKSSTDDERRRYFDTMRVLRLDRGKVGVAFADDLTRGFAPVVAARNTRLEFDIDSLSIQPTEELEEKIAITNMAAKAEGLFKNPIWELERHLDYAARELGVPVSPLALGPGRICDAFGKATAVLDTEFAVKLVIYKLFDRVTGELVLELPQEQAAKMSQNPDYAAGQVINAKA